MFGGCAECFFCLSPKKHRSWKNCGALDTVVVQFSIANAYIQLHRIANPTQRRTVPLFFFKNALGHCFVKLP